MTGRRISLVGCSGVGKTHLARRIEQEWGLPRLELDGLFHQPGWEPLPTEEFMARVDAFMDAHDSWVIDGNYSRIRDRVWERATTVVWLDLPRWRTMWQVGWRTLSRAVTRAELWNGNRERIGEVLSRDPQRSILRWAWTQHPVYRERYARMQADPCWGRLEHHRLRSRRAVEQWLECASTE